MDGKKCRVCKQLSTMWPLIFLYGSSVGLVIPIIPYISLNFFAQKHAEISSELVHCELTPEAQYCKDAVHDNVAWNAMASVVKAVIQAALGPAVGAVSDAYGRKPLIAVCSVLRLLPLAAQLLFVYFNVSLYLWYAMSIFDDIPVMGVYFAAITDLIGDPSAAAVGFGLVLVAFECAVLLGMLCGFMLSMRIQLAASFLITILNVMYQVFMLQESFPEQKRQPLKTKQLVPVVGLSILLRSSKIKLLAFVFFSTSFLGAGLASVTTAYLQKYMYWTKQYNIIKLMIGQASILVWVGLALRMILKRYGEVGLLQVGQIAQCITDLCMYFVSGAGQVWILTGLTSGAESLAFPATAALKGGMVDQDEQGQVQGAVQTVKIVASSLGPVVFGALFNLLDSARETKWSAGLVYIVGVVLNVSLMPFINCLPRDTLVPIVVTPEIDDVELVGTHVDSTMLGNVDGLNDVSDGEVL